MSKETRLAKRNLRKANRTKQKEAFTKFIEAVKGFKNLNLDANQNLSYQDKFKQVWPAIKPAIEFVVLLDLTREKFDAAANEIIALGENMFKGNAEASKTIFTQKLEKIWNNIEFALEMLKIIANDEQDVIIDKIIEIGEWIFE